MLKSEYGFYLTDEQRCAARDVCLDNVYFGSDGSVIGIKFDDYDIEVFTFRKDGGIVKEVRDFEGGWTTVCRDRFGKWIDEEGEEVE